MDILCVLTLYLAWLLHTAAGETRRDPIRGDNNAIVRGDSTMTVGEFFLWLNGRRRANFWILNTF